jgi:hypothetical protein
MDFLSRYFKRNGEATFALLILVAVPTINYLIPYKLVFLNFFFIAILLGAYYLEAHKAILGGVLTTLLVVIYAYLFPASFMPTFTQIDLWMNILAWASFLILTGGVIGTLVHRLNTEVQEIRKIKQDLEAHAVKLEIMVTKLMTE